MHAKGVLIVHCTQPCAVMRVVVWVDGERNDKLNMASCMSGYDDHRMVTMVTWSYDYEGERLCSECRLLAAGM